MEVAEPEPREREQIVRHPELDTRTLLTLIKIGTSKRLMLVPGFVRSGEVIELIVYDERPNALIRLPHALDGNKGRNRCTCTNDNREN